MKRSKVLMVMVVEVVVVVWMKEMEMNKLVMRV
jgi:hypothetical protein